LSCLDSSHGRHFDLNKYNIFDKNREISILTMKKKPPARFNTSSRSHRKIQIRKDTNKTKQKYKKQKTKNSRMNQSASPPLVYGPLTVVCMIVT
jgi:hypothetical protein